jgi:hypothetical protein
MNSRIAPWPICITLGEGGEEFRKDRRFQDECLGLAIRCLVVLLSQRDDLFTREQTAINNKGIFAFSASLAVSLALANVVLICSCSKREVTRFLWYFQRQCDQNEPACLP